MSRERGVEGMDRLERMENEDVWVPEPDVAKDSALRSIVGC